MQQYYIHIGEVYNVETKNTEPHIRFQISEEVLGFIDSFANVKIDSQCSKIYIINNIEFTVHPEFE